MITIPTITSGRIINATPDHRLSRADAASFLGLSAKTMANWALTGKGPRSIRVGGRRFYYLADLQAFVQGETCQ